MAYFIAAYITKQRFTMLTKNGGGDHKRRLSRVHYICTMHCVQCTLEKQCTAHHVIIQGWLMWSNPEECDQYWSTDNFDNIYYKTLTIFLEIYCACNVISSHLTLIILSIALCETNKSPSFQWWRKYYFMLKYLTYHSCVWHIKAKR